MIITYYIYKTIWTKIEDRKNIEFDALPVYADRYMKSGIGTYGDNVHTNFFVSNVPEGGVRLL